MLAVPLKTFVLWQVWQACAACTPERSHAEWTYLACFQDASENLWQASQEVEKPAAAWLGLCEVS